MDSASRSKQSFYADQNHTTSVLFFIYNFLYYSVDSESEASSSSKIQGCVIAAYEYDVLVMPDSCWARRKCLIYCRMPDDL